ncbi:unnamed protein product [Owenia fusiformis]|uniref:Uncharacterized protein n=1 Tax=Owenia fusiformis TaxID=6347 RepID=A0A8J1TF98_OWEFU|nr:unnamed protein product [Owenia fusiformis]
MLMMLRCKCHPASSKAQILIAAIFIMSVFTFWTSLLPYEAASCDLNNPRVVHVKAGCLCNNEKRGQPPTVKEPPYQFMEDTRRLQDTLTDTLEFTKRLEAELNKIKSSLGTFIKRSRSGEVIMGIQNSMGKLQGLQDLMKEKYQIIQQSNSYKHRLGGKELVPSEKELVQPEKELVPTEKELVQPGKRYLVCPEMFNGTTFGYPFFYEGFVDLPCYHPPLSSLITILINMADYSHQNHKSISAIFRGVSKHFNEVQLIIGHRAGQNIKNVKIHHGVNVSFSEFSTEANPGFIWNELIGQVKTQFVLIGRDLQMLTWDIRLDRLIRESELMDTPIVGGAIRTNDGHWSIGCQQFRFRNYTLVYKSGYDLSNHECVFCDHLQGPFLAKTRFMTLYPFSTSLPREVLFESFFLNVNQHLKKQFPLCPDSMFHVETTPIPERDIWIPFAKRWNVYRLRLSSGQLYEFDCKESKTGFDRGDGMAQSPCRLQELADLIKAVMSLCEKNNILCELQEGTALGAVKFNKVLPWELDADVTFHSSNFSKFEALASSFQKLGYGLSVIKKPWCCVDGVIAGGIFNVYSQNWNVEMYGQHLMDSEKMILKGLSPTQVHFDGQWVNVPTNPGLFVRNRYGKEVYQHAQHWMTLGHSTGWTPYIPSKFKTCSKPGDMACLDQFLADGNLQFEEPLI